MAERHHHEQMNEVMSFIGSENKVAHGDAKKSKEAWEKRKEEFE